MSSKGKRSSILKKQNHYEQDDPTGGTSTNVYKGSKKIGFHRKMSIKEFTIGENTETIWGNSYEVSADGTSPRVVCDDTHTLNGNPSNGNTSDSSTSNHPEALLVQEENKENVTLVPAIRTDPAQEDNSASASNSWDLSITIADDEKRRLRSESMLNCSQSLNMTERLLLEPTHLSSSSAVRRRSSTEVLAMDVSPLKPTVTVSANSRSPRKMMYYNPKQGVTVQINDVPPKQAQPAAREDSTNRGYKRSMPCDRSETWNSHPQAMFQLSALRRSNEGFTDMSSDFDNTIAITNTVEKLLKAGANLTLTVPTNMELDESATVTDVKLPTNALARARPSFLPSQNRQQDVSQDEEEYVESIKVPAPTVNTGNPPTERQLNETESIERTSVAPNTLFDGNLSLSFEDVQQPVMDKSASVSRATKSDFKISSMSLGLSLNSPEPVNVERPKIFRPTLPLPLFESISKTEPPKRTLAEDGPCERGAITRQTLHTAADMDETRVYEASSAKPKQSILAPISMDTVAKQPSSRSYRATVYETDDMIDGDEGQPSSTSAQRATVLHRKTMELSNHFTSVSKTKAQQKDSSVLPTNRRTVHAQQPMDESTVEQTAREPRELTRMTKHDRVTMLETNPVPVRGRNTVYPNEPMVQDLDTETDAKVMYSQCTATVSRNVRQTIINNDSMVLDNPEPRVSPISCGIYVENGLNAVSAHAECETLAMDLTVARGTTKHHPVEPCDTNADNRSRPTTMVMQECMRLSEVYAPQHPVMQTNEHSTMPTDEDDGYYGTMGCNTDVDHPRHVKSKSSISTYQSIAMDQTEIVEREHCNHTAHGIDRSKKEQIHHSRPTTHQVEAMEVTSTRKDQFVLADQMPIVAQYMQVSEEDRNAGVKQLTAHSPGLSSVPGSPMDMSTTAVVDPNQLTRMADERSTLNARANSIEPVPQSTSHSQRSRYSIYQAQDMEQTLPSISGIESPKERTTLQATRSTLRKAILQKIVRQTPVEDMEGISLLTDDDDLRAVQTNEPLLTISNRATMHFIDDAAQIGEESMVAATDAQLLQAAPMDCKLDRAINRQTTYEAHAMERETNVIRGSSKMVETREVSRYEPIVQINSKEDRPKQRQTICGTVAMEEETSSYQPLAIAKKAEELCHEEPIVEMLKSTHDRTADRLTIYDMQEEADIVASGYPKATKIFTSEELTKPIVLVNSKEGRTKQRQTICEAVAMEEETSSYHPLAMVDKDPIVEIPKHDRLADRQTICDMYAMRDEQPEVVSTVNRASTKLLTTEERTAYDEPIGLMHSKRHRQTIYDTRAMEEETCVMPIVHHGTAHSRLENEAPGSAKYVSERKSSVCMEETIALLPVRRIERNDTLEGILSEPSNNLQPERKRETIYPIDDTMEITLGAAASKVSDKQHRTSRMDIAEKRQHQANRQTKIHLAPMETTVMHEDHSPAGDDGPYRNPLTHHLSDKPIDQSPVFQQQQQQQQKLAHETPVSVKRETSRRPRQTILLAQDMDIEDTAEHVIADGHVKEEEESFAFPKLVRETTDDCVMRCAPPARMVRGREGFSDAIGEPYAKPSRSTTIAMDKSSIGYPADLQLQQLQHAPDRAHSASIYQESIDISISQSLLPTEPPQIDNISGHYMSMRDVTAPLAKAKQLTATEENSASVASVIRHGSTTLEPEPLQSVMVAPPAAAAADTASDDEFHDAEDDELTNDPLSLTKSRHLLQSMKFVDVEQLERTTGVATSKRVHANVRSSSSTVDGLARDPLHVTLGQQPEDPQPSTPQGPLVKKKRVSSSPATLTANTMPVMQPLDESPADSNEAVAAVEQYDPLEGEPIPESSRAFALITGGRRSVINDPSVFVIDDDADLLDDESQLTSFTEEQLLSDQNTRQEDQQENATPSESSCVKRFFKPLNDLSYYRDFANLTLSEWYEEEQPEQQEQQPCDPVENAQVADCITISDDSVTAPMANLTVAQQRSRRSSGSGTGVLDSTIADEFMEKLMAKLPRKTKHPCCGSDNDCLCRLRRQLERRRKADEREWQLFDQQLASSVSASSSEVSASAFEQRFEELCWRLGDLEQDLSSILETALANRKERDEGSVVDSTSEAEEFHSWRLSGGSTFPEIPDVAFLYENLRRCLQEQPRVDDSPPAGAHLPRVPHITLLVANKLATEHEASGWCLDLSEEALFDHLMFRHRTIPSFHVSVQLQPVHSAQPGSTRKTTRPGVPREKDHYIDRIQVETTDAFEAVRISPMRSLLHAEFMRLTMETTEQTLRSKYRTVGSLMGLWRHFSELFECATRNVQRLLTIVENGDAILTYDSITEQFCVKKWFQRHQDTVTGDRRISNVLQVYFSTINDIAPSGVRFNRPFHDAHDLLSSVTVGPANDPCTGPMFLECLLWKITKLY